MITNLKFKLEPDELYYVIRKNVSLDDFDKKYNNLKQESVNIDKLSYDIYQAYRRLYATSNRLGGDIGFENISQTNFYKEFVAKMFYRYKAAYSAYDTKEHYCWMAYLLANYTSDEVYKLCNEAFVFMKKQAIRRERFLSADIKTRAGQVEISYSVGIGDIAEMASLYKALEDNGIDVYIVSASFIDIVTAFATSEDNIYKMDKNKVFGLRLSKDSNGKILPKLDPTYDFTQKEGKVKTIKSLIQNDKNFGPIMVGGDSDGDYPMLTSFPETKLAMIVDRKRNGKINDLKAKALAGSDKYYLQARNLKLGIYIKDRRSSEIN